MESTLSAMYSTTQKFLESWNEQQKVELKHQFIGKNLQVQGVHP